jgi:nucleoside-diphosphate-sugar epimerase
MAETALLTGTLEASNEPYAIAKIAGIKLCESYNRQYGGEGVDYRSVMPTNLYGPGDNYHPDNRTSSRRCYALPRGQGRGRAQRHDLGQRHAPSRVPVRRRHGLGLRARDGPGHLRALVIA